MSRNLYLGKALEGNIANANLPLDNLTKHCAIFGGSGSGKTGLGINLIESCLLNGVPVIAIDPKGDIGNLLYMPSDFSGEEFYQFLYPNQGGSDPEVWGAREMEAKLAADRHKESWINWGIPPYLGNNLLGSTDIRLYTPGADYGLPLGLYATGGQQNGGKLVFSKEQCTDLARSMLKLVGLNSEPHRTPVILVEQAIWAVTSGGKEASPRLVGEYLVREGHKGVDCREANQPLLGKIGNALLALGESFSFKKWSSRQGLDIAKLFRNEAGTPLCSILNVAHLGEEEKSFFLCSLFTKLAAWMQGQSGSSELKMVLYIDECSDLIPSVKNPQTKSMLMKLVKQARAFGLGIVLATQNPGDIDYKALANIDTWICGLLKTERDRSKIVQSMNNKGEISEIISGLGKREFVVCNGFGESSCVIESRQTMCLLKGPMNPDEIRRVTAWRRLPDKEEWQGEDIEALLNEQYGKCIYPSENAIARKRSISNYLLQLKEMVGA